MIVLWRVYFRKLAIKRFQYDPMGNMRDQSTLVIGCFFSGITLQGTIISISPIDSQGFLPLLPIDLAGNLGFFGPWEPFYGMDFGSRTVSNTHIGHVMNTP